MQAPCKNCENRHPNCHSKCDPYQAYVQENRKRNEKRLIETQVVNTIIDHKTKMYFRRQRQKLRGGREGV